MPPPGDLRRGALRSRRGVARRSRALRRSRRSCARRRRPLHGGPLTFLRFAREHHMLRLGYAAADRPLAVAEAALARAPADRRAVLRLPRREVRDRPRRDGEPRPLVVDRPRLQGPRRTRATVSIGAKTRARPGVHDLRLPARLDRPRVHHRRPRDDDRLRPRGGRGRAADPRAGDLQARRRTSATTSGSATAPASCAASPSATTPWSARARWSPATCPPTRSSAGSRRG